MSYIDLQSVLAEWDYDPEQISARKLLGEDGQVKIQVRVELGLMQMEADGRPDGAQPRGCGSLLDHYQQQLARYEERNGTRVGFALSPDQCQALYEEACQHYRRYVALFVLEDFRRVVRDTTHSLAILDMCGEHALDRRDRQRFEVFRPHALMMDARARACQALKMDEPVSALAHVNRGLLHIETHFERLGRPELFNKCEEVQSLLEIRDEMADEMPKDCLIVTRNALREAIEEERFEEAAELRDQLKDLRHPQDRA